MLIEGDTLSIFKMFYNLEHTLFLNSISQRHLNIFHSIPFDCGEVIFFVGLDVILEPESNKKNPFSRK